MNLNFLLDLAVLFALVILIRRAVYLRSKRKTILKEYKRGSASYEALNKSLGMTRLVIIAAALVLIIIKTTMDIRVILHANSNAMVEVLLPLTLFAALLSGIVLYTLQKSGLWEFYGDSDSKSKR